MSSLSGGARQMQTRQVAAQTARHTLQQHGAEATRELREALGLLANPDDTSILGTALARAAAREIQRNPAFANDIRKEYGDLLRLRGSVRQSGTRKVPLEPLVALRHLDVRTIDAWAPPDPKDLIYVYGQDKLGRALHEYTLDMLKQTADRVQAQHPGTKPKSRASKQSVIDYIVQYSVGIAD